MKAKKSILIYSFIIIGMLSTILFSCKKDSKTDTTTPTLTYTGTTVTDIDGNVYHTVTIGSQVWLAENLKTTRFRDGTSLRLMQTDTTPAYYYYDNLPSNIATYGLLYNWYAATSPHGLAPAGYHIPTDGDWQTLVTSLGGAWDNGGGYTDTIAGGKLKETGVAHWGVGSLPNSNVGATNSSGFTGLPGGELYQGVYTDIRTYGVWWSSTNLSGPNTLMEAYNFYLFYADKTCTRGLTFKDSGCSLRCLKD